VDALDLNFPLIANGLDDDAAPWATITVREVSPFGVDPVAWDAFAASAGGSIRSTHAHMMGRLAKGFGRLRLRVLELHSVEYGVDRKIGQCVVGMRAGRSALFLDRIQLLHAYEGLWGQAMRAVLDHVGAGDYEYGWELNLEPSRENDLAQLAGVVVERSTQLVVQAVDFSRWPSWNDFFAALRKGARQSAQFAKRDLPGLAIQVRTGRSSIGMAPALLQLRSALARRKGLRHHLARLALCYLGWILFSPDLTLMATAKHGRRVLAAHLGADFADNSYYLDGASVERSLGASWALLLTMMQRAYDRNPKGRFVMGYINYAIHDPCRGDGLLQSRAACRVSDYPTAIVHFRVA
jgi:hypothetical protein